MSIFKKAFTLAEVLITIGIIGIVAALTLPSLMRLHQDAGTGPVLAKIQTSVEEAVGRVLLDNPDVVLKNLDASGLVGYLDDVLIMTSIGSSWYSLKDGTCIMITDGSSGTVPTSAGTGKFLVTVDINGRPAEANPNKEGVDMFQFVLTTHGLMIPVGSKTLGQGGEAAKCSADDPSYYCTGRIADNNWKVDY